jgi:hypothetical protein
MVWLLGDSIGRFVRACSQIVNLARQTSLSPRSRPAILFRAGVKNCFSNDPRCGSAWVVRKAVRPVYIFGKVLSTQSFGYRIFLS